jgi:microcystin-dependent protein
MILAPAPVQQYTDDNGNLLVGGQLFVYAAGTTTKQAPFTDATGDTALPDPIVLNARGEVAPSAVGTSCGMWLDPTLAYKFVLAPANDTDPPTNPFWTIDNVVSPQSAILAALQQYEAALGGVPIGSMLAYGGPTAPTGWLLCYGQAVSRTTYAALFAVLGTAYGVGDGASTFNLPDKRGRVSIGADNMGGSAAGNVTSAVSGINANVVGASGGNQNSQTDPLTATSILNIAVTDPGHIHTIGTNEGVIEGNLGTNPGFGSGNLYNPTTTVNTTGSSVTGLTITGSVATTVTSGLTGASQNMPPTQVDNWIIYTGTSS